MRFNNGVFLTYFLLAPAMFWFMPRVASAVPANFQEAQNLKAAEQEGVPATFEVPQVEYNATGLRDPFKPEPVGEEAVVENITDRHFERQPLPPLKVQGIVWGGVIPQAIINNQVVKIGDLISGVRVVDIKRNGITVFYSGYQHIIAAPATNMIEEHSPNSKGGLDEGAK